jgi:hypothetical protein
LHDPVGVESLLLEVEFLEEVLEEFPEVEETVHSDFCSEMGFLTRIALIASFKIDDFMLCLVLTLFLVSTDYNL